MGHIAGGFGRVVLRVAGLGASVLLGAAAITATASADDTYLAAIEQIESDPSLVEQLALDEALGEAWVEAMTCRLLVSPNPRVRLYASLSLNHRAHPLTCAETGGPVDARAIREGLAAESEDPAILHAIYAADCQPSHARRMNAVLESNDMASVAEYDERLSTHCAANGTPAKLRALDPGNAAVRLLQVSPPWAELSDEDYASYRDVMTEASRAERFDLYYLRGSLEVYDALAATMEVHPPPDLSRGVDDLLAPIGAQALLHSPWWMGLGMIMAPSFSDHYAAASTVSLFCGQARKREDEPALKTCRRLAGLMEREGTYMGRHFGQALRWRLDSPLDSASDTQAYANQWKNRLRQLEMECQRPRGLQEMQNWDAQREQQIRQYVADLSSVGERHAMVQAAEREQAHTGVARLVDPARCEELWALDEATQRDLLDLMRVQGSESGRYSEALQGLAEALATPAAAVAGGEPAS